MAEKKGGKAGKAAVLFFVVLFLLCAGVIYLIFFKKRTEVYTYRPTNEVFYNPLMGFAVNADYPDAVDQNTLVYVDITWREWEPEQGVYAVEEVRADNFWERWRQEGKHVVLRFVCDNPSREEHMDIPDWLYEQTGDGVPYDHEYGRGYAPEYGNPVFTEAHRQAILALGEAFGQDSMVAYIELGSLGHWGEWHMRYASGTTRMPASGVRAEYVRPYLEAFPSARLLARRPFPETAELGLGVYNDMTGEPDSTQEWLSWIAEGGSYSQPVIEERLTAQPDIWKTAPVGGEFTSALTYDEMLDEKLERTVDLLKASHSTFIGPKCPVAGEVEEYRRGVEEVMKAVGYRYGVSRCAVKRSRAEETCEVTLTLENRGSAPLYFPWTLYLYIYNADGQEEYRMPVPVDLTKISDGESAQAVLRKVPIVNGGRYGVCIEDPDTGKPAVLLDMDCEQDKKVYLLWQWD